MNRRIMQWIGSGLALIVVCAGLYFASPGIRATSIQILEWIDSIGYWAPIAFVGIAILGVLLILPGFLFTMGAGYLFGLVKGVLLVWIAINVGSVAAFLIGRHTVATKFIRFLGKYERIEEMNDVLRLQGWKTIMFTRMIPFFPFKLSNYVFGMAGYSLKDFWLGTAIGILPITIFNVYMGSIAGALTKLGAEDQPMSTLQWAVYIAGFVILCIAVVCLARIGRRTLQQHESVNDSVENGTGKV